MDDEFLQPSGGGGVESQPVASEDVGGAVSDV